MNARSRSRIRTDGRTLVLGPQRSSSPAHAQPRVEPAIDPSRLPFISYRTTATWTARSLTFYVMSYACAHGRCHTARRPPHVMFLTRPSPRLAIFIGCYVARAYGTPFVTKIKALTMSHYKHALTIDTVRYSIYALTMSHSKGAAYNVTF